MTPDSAGPTLRLSIAIVDDEELVRISLRRLCRALGLAASVYASGKELIEALDARDARPDCLLLDAHMPDMTGLEVQQQLVGRGVRFPTIVYSADDAPEALDRYAGAGAVAYLRKPMTGDQLMATIERAVTASRATQQAR
ncbi:MAG TPA: response regulator [Gemmatimonadaceae bacterium]|jgi:FixJ family two-component response regulator